jgi:hypothetical protein
VVSQVLGDPTLFRDEVHGQDVAGHCDAAATC